MNKGENVKYRKWSQNKIRKHADLIVWCEYCEMKMELCVWLPLKYIQWMFEIQTSSEFGNFTCVPFPDTQKHPKSELS